MNIKKSKRLAHVIVLFILIIGLFLMIKTITPSSISKTSLTDNSNINKLRIYNFALKNEQLKRAELNIHSKMIKPNLLVNNIKRNAICNIHKKYPNFFDEKVKIWSLELPQESIYMIQASSCPKNLFSFVVIKNNGNIERFIDCHSTSTEELVLNAGVQGDIKESNRIKENRFDLAISGPGFFVEKCRNNFYLIRKGDFLISIDKTLMTSNGCIIIDQNGLDFKVNTLKLDEHGCSKSQCLSIVQPNDGEFKFINRNRLTFSGNLESSKIEDPTIFVNSLEDIENGAGIIGPIITRFSELNMNMCE